MPVRSLHSSVLRWPDREAVLSVVRSWAVKEVPGHAGLLCLGIFGSLARGDWGVGSDIDLIATVKEADGRFYQRSLSWDLLGLPVPAELLVYTEAEWKGMRDEGTRFARTVEDEAIWLFDV
jgi:hypothetical protein